MAKIKNPWVGYLERSYLQIKNSLLKKLGDLVPEVTDHSESNILVIILSMFAGLAENLNYYIDNMAREAFITTARRYSSVIKHTRLIDYRIKARIPASTSVIVSLFGNETIINTGGLLTHDPFTIPAGTEFSTDNGLKFISLEDTYFANNTQLLPIQVSQKTRIINNNLGTTTGIIGQIFSLGEKYVHDSLILEVGGELWERKQTLGRSTPTDKHYIIDISAEKIAYVVFGDDINGKNPESNLDLIGTYYESEGARGNVDINNINQVDFDFVPYMDEPDLVIVFNPLKAVAGTDYEDIQRIQRSAPLSIRTLDRAVTRQDYIDIAKLAPGVDKATLHFDCGKSIDIYISPNGGGIASEELLNTTKDFVDERRMVTTFVNIYPAGESYIYLNIAATAKFRRDGLITKQTIIDTLVDKYSYENSDVNRKIRKSDIIALVDNIESVDFLDLQEIYLKPYMRPFEHIKELLHTFKLRSDSDAIVNWELRFYGSVMKLFKFGVFVADIQVGVDFIDPSNTFYIKIHNNAYENGMVWKFTTYPYNTNLEVNDFTVPVIREQDIDLVVTEQLIIN